MAVATVSARVPESVVEGGPRPAVDVARAAEAAPAGDQRRLVTALFADIAGFTSLADRLDPEQLIEIMDPILSRMNAVVQRYGGVVSKYAGDAVLAFFGAPVAHEDDALRALLAAWDMHAEVAQVVAGLPEEGRHLTLHMGVNTGRVVTGTRGADAGFDYSVLGDAVNVAQRLEAACPTGEVYVGEQTHLLTRDVLDFAEVGELTVKGKPEPVRAWRLLGPHIASTSSSSDAATSAAMVGRDAELAAATAGMDAALAGHGRLVTVIGEPGVGKSRLLEGARTQAQRSGLQWDHARCLSYGAGLAYRPYADLIRGLFTADATGSAPDLTRALLATTTAVGATETAPYLLHLLGLHVPDVGSGAQYDGDGHPPVMTIPPVVLANPEALRRALQDAITGFLVALARTTPRVVAIEDLHWCDPASLDVTALLAMRARHEPLCLVVTSRPEGTEACARVQRACPQAPIALHLDPLPADATAQLVADVLGGSADPRFSSVVAVRTAGNPLFVQETVRSLQDSGALTRGAGGWRLADERSAADVPDTVERVLAARIDLLPHDAADVLQIAAVLGPDVRLELLSDISGVAEHDLQHIVSVLAERHLIRRTPGAEGTRATFHHALLAEVAYGRLLRKRRRELHSLVVRAATRRYGDGDDVVDLLAHHAYHAEMGPEAVRLLRQAAARAITLFANREAITHLTRALELTAESDAQQARELRMRLAAVHAIVGEYETALTLYTEAYEHHPDVPSLLGRSAALRRLGRVTDAIALLRALGGPVERGTDGAAQLATEHARCLGMIGATEDADALFASAAPAVEGTGTSTEATLLMHWARVLEMQERHQDALPKGERAVQLLEELGDLPTLSTALRVLGGVRHEAADEEDGAAIDRAADTLQRALAVARQVGDAEEQAAALINLSRVRSGQERHQEALEAAQEALVAFQDAGILGGIAAAHCNIAEYLLELDRAADARDAAQAGLVAAEAVGNPYWVTGALIGLAQAHLDLDMPALALGYADRAIAAAREAALGDREHTADEWAAKARERIAAAPDERRGRGVGAIADPEA